MENKRLVDVAFDILKEKTVKSKVKEVDFFTLWEDVCKFIENNKEQFPIDPKTVSGQFFTDLILDNRFFSKDGKTWSLAIEHSYKELIDAKTALGNDVNEEVSDDDEKPSDKKEVVSEEDD